MRGPVALAVLCVSLPAAAESPPTKTVDLAVGVNAPFRWDDREAIAGSLYIGISQHHAIRANVAAYDFHSPVAGDLFAAIVLGEEGGDAITSGRIIDTGVAWMYFPRKLWDGFSLEAGLLHRSRDTLVENDFAREFGVQTNTSTIAGRAMIGWSWLLADRVFLSTALGMSLGYEYGRETIQPRERDPMTREEDVGRLRIAGEAFLRLGVAFGL